MTLEKKSIQGLWPLPAIFILGRLILLISLPLEGLVGYGDFVHFFGLARLGRPFLDYWVEFPPLFPFLSQSLYQLARGQEHLFFYLLAIFFSAAQMGSLALFIWLSERLSLPDGNARNWLYLVLLSVTAYGWWYFDPLVVLSVLLVLVLATEGRTIWAGLVLALGILLKWFPLLLLPALWRSRPRTKALLLASFALGGTGLVWGLLFLRSPAYTAASLSSQANKGSWETPWALIDGNLSTGNFGPEIERYTPEAAERPRGGPAVIPPTLTLIVFAILGGWVYWKTTPLDGIRVIAFSGLTLSLFFLWLPGWSPQWALYLLPLILLTTPVRTGALLSAVFLFVNLLEWPVFLSRGLFWGLWLTIPLRTVLLAGLAVYWAVEVLYPDHRKVRPASSTPSLELRS